MAKSNRNKPDALGHLSTACTVGDAAPALAEPETALDWHWIECFEHFCLCR
jgi:hypothetical protein